MSRWSHAVAFGSRDPAIFGFRVRPLTLGHIRLLDELGLKIDTTDFGEAATVCCLCSQPFAESRRDLGAFWFGWLLRFRIRRVSRKADLPAELKAFREWAEYNLGGPTAKRRGGEPKGVLAAPIYFNLAATLMGAFGMSVEDSEKMPIKTARQLLAAHYEASGSVELWTEREYKFEAWCKEADSRGRSLAGANIN